LFSDALHVPQSTEILTYDCIPMIGLHMLAFFFASKHRYTENPTHMSLPATWWLLFTPIPQRRYGMVVTHSRRASVLSTDLGHSELRFVVYDVILAWAGPAGDMQIIHLWGKRLMVVEDLSMCNTPF
jgi:hypothetical protein